eukprot:357497_1
MSVFKYSNVLVESYHFEPHTASCAVVALCRMGDDMMTQETNKEYDTLKAGVKTHHLVMIFVHYIIRRSGENNDANAQKLLRVLGGIDTILEHYLEDSSLTVSQLEQINQILSTPIDRQSTYKCSATATSITITTDQNTEDQSNSKHKQHEMHEMDIRDNIIFSLCGKSLSKYYIVTNILTGKIAVFIWFIFIALFILLGSFATGSYILAGYRLFINITWIVQCSLLLLLYNKTILGLVLRTSFEFWLKSIYSIVFGMALWWSATYEDEEVDEFMAIVNIFGMAATVLSVIGMSAIDALYTRRKVKICACMIISLLFVYSYVVTAIRAMDEEEQMRSRIHFSGFTISLLSLRANTLQVLTLFICKQTVLITFNPWRCVTVRTPYYVKWIGQKAPSMSVVHKGDKEVEREEDDGDSQVKEVEYDIRTVHQDQRDRDCSISLSNTEHSTQS